MYLRVSLCVCVWVRANNSIHYVSICCCGVRVRERSKCRKSIKKKDEKIEMCCIILCSAIVIVSLCACLCVCSITNPFRACVCAIKYRSITFYALLYAHQNELVKQEGTEARERQKTAVYLCRDKQAIIFTKYPIIHQHNRCHYEQCKVSLAFSVCTLSIHNHNLKRKKNEFQQKLNEHFVCFIKNAALFSFFQFILVFSRSETSWVIFVVYFAWLFFSACNFALFPCCDFCSYILHVCETKLHFFLNECSRAALKIYFPSSNTTKKNRNFIFGDCQCTF